MIDTFFTILKKSLLLVVLTIFAFTITYIPQLHTDEAGQQYATNVEYAYAGGAIPSPVDIANLIENTGNHIINAARWVMDQWLYLKENVLDGLTWLLGEEMLADMTGDIVDWVNSGFEGSPRFIENLDDFLLEHADRRVGEFINSLGGLGSFVCDPFKIDTQIAVAIHYDVNRVNREKPECTITEVIDNLEDFIGGDFRSGGWEGWFELTSNPQNTPYGSVLTGQRLVMQEAAQAKQDKETKAGWSGGYRSIEHCEDIDGGSGPVERCNIVTPGEVISSQLNKALGVGQDRVVEGDEFNEMFSFLLSRIAGDAIGGSAGLLGLSGGTGETYSSYTRGSFEDDYRVCDGVLVDGEVCIVDGAGDGGINITDPNADFGEDNIGSSFIADARDDLLGMEDEVADYVRDLRAFVANPRNDEGLVITAQIYLDQAEDLEDRIASNLVEANRLADNYDALEAAYNATDDPQEQANFRAEQADLLQEFNALGVVSEAELNIFTNRWDDLLAENVGALDICETNLWADGCLCDTDPDAFLCRFGDLDGIR